MEKILFLKVFDYKEEEWELEDNYVSVIPAPYRKPSFKKR